ncbi:MAG: ATP synthase subunit I, partial [Deltaproteobacteria bacterium]|nr:ATP synthase subunit I [Deltaproteobacteria bacterium]
PTILQMDNQSRETFGRDKDTLETELLAAAIDRQSIIFWLLASVVSLWWRSLAITGGVFIGGFISIVSYWWLCATLKEMLRNSSKVSISRCAGSYVLRAVCILGALFVSIVLIKCNVFALSVGLSTVIVSITIEVFKYLINSYRQGG